MVDDTLPDVDDFDSVPPPSGGVTTAVADSPPAAAVRAGQPLSPDHGPADSIRDDGVQFGYDPEFAQSASSTSGLAFDVPDNAEILVTRSARSAASRRRDAVRGDDTAEDDAPVIEGESKQQRRRREREERRADSQARRQQQAAQRAQRKADRAAEQEQTAEQNTGGRRRRRLLAPAAALAVVGAGAVGAMQFIGDSGDSTNSVDAILPDRSAAAFAAGDGCVPGTDSAGATITNSAPADTGSSGPAAIGGMEHAYYALKDGNAVATFMSPTLTPDGSSIQAALDSYFPAGDQVAYCMKIAATDDPNVSDVQIIESRNGIEKTRVHQEITTEQGPDGRYVVSRVVKVD